MVIKMSDFWTDAVQDMNKKLDKAEKRIEELEAMLKQVDIKLESLQVVYGNAFSGQTQQDLVLFRARIRQDLKRR